MKSPLMVIFVTIALDLVGFGMVVPMLPLYAKTFGASATAVAVLLASYSLMQFIFAPLWGGLSDRIGRRPVLLTCITGNALALLAYGMAPSYGWLLAARVAAGICNANIAVANAYVADVTSDGERARGMGLVGAAFGIGFVLGPFFGGELSRFGFAAVAQVAAALSICNGVAAFFRLPESLPLSRRRTAGLSPWRQRLTMVRDRQFSGVLLLLIFLQIFAFAMLEMALSLFARVRLHFDPEHVGRLFAYMGIILVLVQGGAVGRLSKRFGETPLVQVGLAILSAGLLATSLTPPDGVGFLFLAMTTVALGQGLCSPALSSLLSRGAVPELQGATLGLSQSVSSLARALGPQLAGMVFDRSGEKWPFVVGAALMGIAWCISMVWLRPKIAPAVS